MSSLTVMVLAAEVVVRYACPAIVAPMTVKDPEIGMRYLRSFAGRVYDAEAHRAVPLRFNRDGFRGPDRPFHKPEGVKRVAVLGDSMIAAISVDEQDTLVGRLEKSLNAEDSGQRWEVMNFGVAGSSPGQALVLYRKLVAKYDPDIVLCSFFVGNDLSDICDRLSMNPRIYLDLDENGELYQKPFSESRATLSAWLNRHSRFYLWQKLQSTKLREHVRAAADMVAPGQLIYCRDESDDVRHAWRITDKTLQAFRDEVEGAGRRFAVVIIPSCEQVYDDFFKYVSEVSDALTPNFEQTWPDERLGRICAEAGIDLLSMYDDFRKATPSHSHKVREEWVFHNGIGHFNERGNRIAARTVHRFLMQSERFVAAGGDDSDE